MTTTATLATETTLENVDVINHLMFHKALVDDEDDGSRINKYLEMAREGEHTTMRDPFDRSIALAFDLVLQEQLNPWDIDLVGFATMYLERAREEKFDLITAGRVVFMAWSVLKLQSDDLVRRTEERQEEAQELDWEDLPDFDFSDEEVDFTQRVRISPRAPIDEKVWHEGDRKVTLMELVDAFETARVESDRRKENAKARDAFRKERAFAARAFTKNRVHKEDLEADIATVWQRILGRNGGAVPLDSLCRMEDPDDFVMAFNSVLFLHRDRRVDLWQEEFPWGTIYVRNISNGSQEVGAE